MTERNREPESRGLMPSGIVQSQIAEILAADAARESGSPRLVDYFCEKLFDKLILGGTIYGGALFAIKTASVSPPIEDPVINFGVKTISVIAAGVGGMAVGGLTSTIGGLAGAVAVLYWKDLARFTNRYIL